MRAVATTETTAKIPPAAKEWTADPDFGSEIKGLVVKDCGADGDCQTRCIAEVIKPLYNVFDYRDIRRIMAIQCTEMHQVNSDWFKTVMITYRAELEDKTFHGKWNPRQVETPEQLAAAIEIPLATGNGWHYQGDDITLSLASQALGVDFLVFNAATKTVTTQLHNRKYLACLKYISGQNRSKHYQALGFSDGQDSSPVQTIFLSDDLPSELTRFLTAWKWKEGQAWARKRARKLQEKIGLRVAQAMAQRD